MERNSSYYGVGLSVMFTTFLFVLHASVLKLDCLSKVFGTIQVHVWSMNVAFQQKYLASKLDILQKQQF